MDDLPRKHFGVVYADPPWRFKTYNENGRKRNPDWRPFKGSPSKHYDTMDLEAIKSLPVKDVCADDCVLLLWMCWPMMPEAMQVINAWGFTYKTLGFDWIKAELWDRRQTELLEELDPIPPDDEIGMGYWTRSNPEACLLATRGKPKRLNADVRAAIIERRREHSRKPECAHGRIERLVAGPYLELFARAPRDGWTVWGNQTDKFTKADGMTATSPLAAAAPPETDWVPIGDAVRVEGEYCRLWVVHQNAGFDPDPIANGWAAECQGYWTGFNGGGWVWYGLCGTVTHWKPV